MTTKRKLKLKEPFITILKFIGIIILIILGLFLFYRSQASELKKLGYSDKATFKILKMMKKKDVLSVGENKTLNKAFESKDYLEKNFNSYSKIKYQNQTNLIKNINKLIKKEYNNEEISMILEHGNDTDVSEFAKRDKVRYLEEFFSIEYAKLKYYDRYVKYMDEEREDEETSVLLVNLDMDKNEYENPVKVDKFSSTMLVNKHRMLDEKFEPDDLVDISLDFAKEKGMKANRTAYIAYKNMSDAAKKEGLLLVINSAYRSYSDQQEIVDTYLKLYGENYVAKYVLKPGFSEHQTGLAFDIGSQDTNVFSNSDEYKWIVDNCYKYGFIYRFKEKYEDITGIRHEAWHYRYVGKKIAKYIYDHNLTYEEYYAMFIDK